MVKKKDEIYHFIIAYMKRKFDFSYSERNMRWCWSEIDIISVFAS